MFKVHGYIDNQRMINRRMAHIPRTGDTVRMSPTLYATVTEVIWCIDEESNDGTRVNIRMEQLK